MNRIPCFIAATCLFAMASGGCTSPAVKTSSTLAGSVAQATFPKAVSAITVKSDAGKTSTVAVGADGRFSIDLEKGAGYQLFLGADGKSIPIVLRSSDQDRLQTQVHVSSGGASLSIGSVRYWGGASASETRIVTGPEAAEKTCVGGVYANSSQPCASGVSAAVCTDSDDEESDDDGDHGEESGDEQGADCVDGLDAVTHQPCDGGPAANPTDGNAEGNANADTDADASSEVGVPEHNVPDDVGCGEEEDEDDDGETAD